MTRGGTVTILGQEANQEETRTHEELVVGASAGAGSLAENGVDRGDRVALFARTTFGFIEGCLAIWRRGAVVVPLPYRPPLGSSEPWLKRTISVLETATPTLLLRGPGDPELVDVVKCLDLEALSGSGTFADDMPGATDNALIQFTSGSTSAPKGIVLDHHAIASNLEALGERFGPPEGDGDILFSWLPMNHDLGFINYLVRPLITGEPIYLLPTENFIQNPLRWAQEMSERQATLCSGPSSAFGLLARELEKKKPAKLDLQRWRYAGNGGEAVSVSSLENLARVGAPHGLRPGTLAPGYGLAEATCTVTARRPGSGWVVDRLDRNELARDLAVPSETAGHSTAVFVSAGPPLQGVELRVVDTRGEILGDRHVGEVLVKSPGLMRGYLDDSSEDSPVSADGWLRTGDRGYLADGDLFVTGRSRDIIIVNGQNYHAEDIERIVDEVPGVRRGNVVAVPTNEAGTEGLAVLAESKNQGRAASACREEIARRLVDEIGIGPARVVMLPPRSVPKTTSGKLKRADARRMLEEGSLAEIGAPPVGESEGEPIADPVERAVNSIFSDVLHVDVRSTDDFFELGGTSLRAMEVIVEIRRRLGRTLAPQVLLTAPTPRRLAEAIRDPQHRPPGTLIRLQADTSEEPLFCVGGGGGTVFHLYALARRLSDWRPVYAMQARGADGMQRPYGTIEEMAARYLSEIRKSYGEPSLLLGYSFGGIVAYEMARQLEAAGSDVRLLALIDAPSTVGNGWRFMTRLWTKQPRLAMWRTLYQTGRIARRVASQTEFAIRKRINGSRLDKFMIVHSRKLAERYHRSRTTFNGKIDFFQAVGYDGVAVKGYAPGWQDDAPGGLHVHMVLAPSHTEMLDEPWVEAVVSKLRALDLPAVPASRK
jgi:acyl-CoA synthetase (AMP-forming)/AMP-acid ligase II/thioesterase domain-containing protein/acyl carrier protein